MPLIRLNLFDGIWPRREDRLLPENGAATAHNVDLSRGHLIPLHGIAAIPARAGTGTFGKAYGYWFSAGKRISWCLNPVAGSSRKSVYYTQEGDGIPKVVMDVSSGWSPLDLAIPAPSGAPTVEANEGLFSVNRTIRLYVYGIGAAGSQTLLTSWDVPRENVVIIKDKRAFSFTFRTTSWPSGSYASYKISCAMTIGGSTIHAYNSDVTGLSASSTTKTDAATGNRVRVHQSIEWFGIRGGSIVEPTIIVRGTVTIEDYFVKNAAASFPAYVYRYVTSYGEEGPPSPPSANVLRPAGAAVRLTGLTVTPAAVLRGVNSIRIYRTTGGLEEDAFRYIDTVAAATAGSYSYRDEKGDQDAVERLQVTSSPPSDLVGLIAMPGGFFAGISGRDVRFSEPGLPTSWPSAYSYAIRGETPIALAPSGNDCVVMTTGQPQLLSGSSPDRMTGSILPLPQMCLSATAVCTLGNSVFYAGADGLIQVSGATARNITEAHYTTEQWLALNPSTRVWGAAGGKVFAFDADDVIIFDLREGKLKISTADVGGSYLYIDPSTDDMYVRGSGGVTGIWNTGTGKTLTWRSKKFLLPASGAFSVGRVIAASYPAGDIVIDIYGDDTLRHTIYPSASGQFRVPTGRKDLWVQVEVRSTVEVYSIEMASGSAELRHG